MNYSKVIVALLVLTIVGLVLTGCTSQPKYNYPTGYAAYGGGQGGGGGQAQHNGYIGGGCAVEGPADTGAIASKNSLAA